MITVIIASCVLSLGRVWCLYAPISLTSVGFVASWIQNVAEPRWNGRVGTVLELGEPRFRAAIALIWNAIAVLKRFSRTATETKIATETAFWILGCMSLICDSFMFWSNYVSFALPFLYCFFSAFTFFMSDDIGLVVYVEEYMSPMSSTAKPSKTNAQSQC